MNKPNRLLKNIGRLRSLGRPKYYLEKRILAGKKVNPRSNSPSILFATIHKAASVYVWEVLKKIASNRKLHSVNFDGHYFRQGELDHELKAEHFQRQGFLYGPFRKGFHHIVDADSADSLNFNDYKIIIQLRDPRDALTSSYYSFLHSHCVLPKDRARIEAVRKRMSDLEIDRHVLGQAAFLDNLLTEYMTYFSKPNCLVLHYEDFVQQPEMWAKQIMNFLDLKGNSAIETIFRRMIRETRDKPTSEKIDQHKRKVTPGEYRSKLKPKTIERLNARFANYFEALEIEKGTGGKRVA